MIEPILFWLACTLSSSHVLCCVCTVILIVTICSVCPISFVSFEVNNLIARTCMYTLKSKRRDKVPNAVVTLPFPECIFCAIVWTVRFAGNMWKPFHGLHFCSAELEKLRIVSSSVSIAIFPLLASWYLTCSVFTNVLWVLEKMTPLANLSCISDRGVHSCRSDFLRLVHISHPFPVWCIKHKAKWTNLDKFVNPNRLDLVNYSAFAQSASSPLVVT